MNEQRRDAILDIEGVSKTFSTKAGTVKAVESAGFRAARGEVVAIIGPSGSGKTTLLYLVGSLEKPDAGTISVAGSDICEPGFDLASYRRSSVGFVFQFFNLIPTLTSLENVTLPMDLAGVAKPDQERCGIELLAHMGIDDERMQKSKPTKLSGGQCQRVAIARALANDPDLILADEPTGNLDAATSRDMTQLLSALAHEDGKCVLIVTHDESVLDIADQSFRMRDGRLEQMGARG